MVVDLIIDGNYLLSRMVFTLHKNNLLFGGLYKSLEVSVLNYRKWYPFSNVYLVSDSREKSWRKNLDVEYKSNRKKNDEIDWDFVYGVYSEFKKDIILKGIRTLESPTIEGDDWISFLVNKANLKKKSTIIVSNDYDIKQIINYNIDPLYINIMSNEMLSRQKVFLPKNYQIFIDSLNNINNDDIFSLNDNSEFIKLIKTFISRYEVSEADPTESLLIKVISGDQSDNISSVWSITKNGKKRGIGDKGAKSIILNYIKEFGDPLLSDPDLFENIADLICEKKKISKTSIESIKSNILKNMKLIHLDMDNLPNELVEKMNYIYEQQL